MPREIPLTKGYVTIVDDCDYDELMKYMWHACDVKRTRGTIVYAARSHSQLTVSKNGKKYYGKKILMQNHLMGVRDGFMVDHISRDSLDNRRVNLRWSTRSQNQTNRKFPKPVSITGFRGVWLDSRGKYIASICCKNKVSRLGVFDSAESAAIAYDNAAKELHGSFAQLNFGSLKQGDN